MNTRSLFFPTASLKRSLSAAAERYALVFAVLIFLLVYWGDQRFPDDISLAPFYCIAIALLVWYRNAASAYLAAICAVLIELYNTPGLATGQIDMEHLVFKSASDLLLFAGFAFVTLQARSHFNHLKLAADSLERLAFHDPLTDLPNRPLLCDRLAIAISQARRSHHHVAVLLLDLDGFNAINDLHGRQAGNDVLKVVASRLLASVRGGDTVARLGGDEFAIVLGAINDTHDATKVADKILSSVGEPIPARDGGSHQIGVSIGISMFPEHGGKIDKLLAQADSAMYRSKSHGKNIYTFFSKPEARNEESSWIEFNRSHETGFPEIDQQHKQLIVLANKLNVALSSGEATEIIKRQFDELVLYTQFHFSTEERLMEQYGYPHQTEHKQSHHRLLSEIGHLKARLNHGDELSTLQTIKDWLMGHIEDADKPLGAHLKQHRD